MIHSETENTNQPKYMFLHTFSLQTYYVTHSCSAAVPLNTFTHTHTHTKTHTHTHTHTHTTTHTVKKPTLMRLTLSNSPCTCFLSPCVVHGYSTTASLQTLFYKIYVTRFV